MIGLWQHGPELARFGGDDVTYRKAADFLYGLPVVEDWGCGGGWFSKFLTRSDYVGIDGSPGPRTSVVTDLRTYRSAAPGIMLRHVLEHNEHWMLVLANALCSFRNRMVLVVFTPSVPVTREINTNANGVPDIAFSYYDISTVIHQVAPDVSLAMESVTTATQYGQETIFYLERPCTSPQTRS